MRELKFRAWYHKGTYCKEPKMYWFDLMWGNTSQQGSGWIGMLPIGETRKYRMMSDNRKQIDPYDCEIMQYTGLKDKNGVAIYERDILQWHEDVSDFHDRIICGTVEFVRGRYILSPRGYYGSLVKVWLDAVIIGNVFENPELL
jgi:uncharacterized phage protein (TIGR01671 family)